MAEVDPVGVVGVAAATKEKRSGLPLFQLAFRPHDALTVRPGLVLEDTHAARPWAVASPPETGHSFPNANEMPTF